MAKNWIVHVSKDIETHEELFDDRHEAESFAEHQEREKGHQTRIEEIFVMGKKEPFTIFEYDSVKREKLKLIDHTLDIEAARKIALDVASQWCEDEIPILYEFGKGTDRNAHFEVCLGHSDFGALIEFDVEHK